MLSLENREVHKADALFHQHESTLRSLLFKLDRIERTTRRGPSIHARSRNRRIVPEAGAAEEMLASRIMTEAIQITLPY